MNLTQAIDHASALAFPGFLSGDAELTAERAKNEEAIGLIMAAWRDAAPGQEPCSFDLVRNLADQNRTICDSFGIERLRDVPASTLQRKLPDSDLLRGVVALQHRSVAGVAKTAGPDLDALNIAYTEAPVSGTVVGIDLETTDRDPARGYIVNVGLAFMDLTPTARPRSAFAGYCGLPAVYEDKGVPLADIHHITWDDVRDRSPFRFDDKVQRALLAALTAYPYMAHNAAFEDSWLMLNLDGYAEARRAGRVTVIDTRDICRRVDPETKTLPHDQRPASLESWARRRGTLKPHEREVHLGIDDVDLMLRTVQAEFAARGMFDPR